MNNLTPQQKQLYLDSYGQKCPFCLSPSISAASGNCGGKYADFEVTCESCGRTWLDVYTLTGVEDCANI